jgi:hypothetical protein
MRPPACGGERHHPALGAHAAVATLRKPGAGGGNRGCHHFDGADTSPAGVVDLSSADHLATVDMREMQT